jgi:sporulation protein YqfD
MRQFTSISGFVAVQLTGADIPALLKRLGMNGITLFRVQQKDILTVLAWVRRKDVTKLMGVAEKLGTDVSVIHRSGFYWMWRSMIRRPVMLAGILLILLLSWFVPTRVLFITVEGNSTVPTNLILEKAAHCGIVFGADRREVRSEKTKNRLIAALPELQWTGINTYGCTAVISVTERTVSEEQTESHIVSSIVADRDGIIYSCTVANGSPACVEGQAVQAGETLISGYTDCGIKIQASRAKGEIYAQTMRQLTVKTPLDYSQKGEFYQTAKKYCLILGKKRINFSKDSGISPTGCDKMYVQYYCVLPGGFPLPISIAVEQWYYYKTESITAASEMTQLYTEEFAEGYLLQQMLSGEILGKLETADIGDAVYTLTGRYICLEMIGRERSEEIIKHDG